MRTPRLAVRAVREKIRAKLLDVNAQAERGVVAAATALGSVVTRAREQVSRTERLLHAISDAEHRGGIAGAIKQLADRVGVYDRQVGEKITAQNALALDAVAQLEAILGAASTIDHLTREANLLTLNARIQAATHGEGGQTFAVIATEMGNLATSIAQTNRTVSGVAASLKEILPRIREQAAHLKTESEHFAVDVRAALSDVQASSSTLSATLNANIDEAHRTGRQIVDASNDALSALQFQDPAAQETLTIDDRLLELERVLREPGAPGLPVLKPLQVRLGDAVKPASSESGAVLLFDATG